MYHLTNAKDFILNDLCSISNAEFTGWEWESKFEKTSHYVDWILISKIWQQHNWLLYVKINKGSEIKILIW